MQKTGDNVIWYTYDENGLVTGFRYNGAEYYYFRNAQNDIIGIVNSSGAVVANYTYDSWGNHIAITDGNGNNVANNPNHIANVNPLRYRGYYYDAETGLYYLQSRYYDANVGRMLNPDDESVLVASPTELTDKNLFSYCDNNPIVRADDGGEFWNVVIGAVVGAVVAVAGQVVSDVVTSALNQDVSFSSWQTYVGAVGGAILGGTGNVALYDAVSGFVSTGVSMGLEKLIDGSEMSWLEIGANAVGDGFMSHGLGKLPGIKNITAGRNSCSAVYKSGLTKLRNKTASHMSAKVIGKGISSDFVGSLAMDGYSGIKAYAYDPIKRAILDIWGNNR